MSLTMQAYQERKWGRYPALRKALEGTRIPDSYYGLTSAYDNMFDALGRLVEIVTLAREYESMVRETAQSVGPEVMCQDLDCLRRDLEDVSIDFRQWSEEIREMSLKVYNGS